MLESGVASVKTKRSGSICKNKKFRFRLKTGNSENVTFVFCYQIEKGKKSKFRLPLFSERQFTLK